MNKFTNENVTDYNNNWLGRRGSKVDLEIVKSEIVYTQNPFTCYSDPIYLYQLKDINGHIILWSTSQTVPDHCKIIAKIKDNIIYDGIKKTIITRGTIYAL